MRRGLGIAFLCAIVLAVTACGSSGSSSSASGGSSGSGGSSSGSSASVSGAKVLSATALNNPPKGTIPHAVLMHVAVGDHQVANVMSDVEARSIGASTAELPARSDDKTPLFGIPRIGKFPFRGSAAVVYWDGGNQTPLPPVTNTPNRGGADPHAFPRNTPAARQQKSDWLSPNGSLSDVCGGQACRTSNFSG